MVKLRTGFNKNKNIKIDYQGTKKKKIKKIKEDIHKISYIKSGTNGKNQIYWFESNKSGRIYIVADKELYNMGFYKYKYKHEDLIVLGTVYKNNNLVIKKIFDKNL